MAQRKPHIKPAYLLPVIPSTYAWYLLADVWESYSEFCVIRRSVEFVCSIPGKSCGPVCVKDLISRVRRASGGGGAAKFKFL